MSDSAKAAEKIVDLPLLEFTREKLAFFSENLSCQSLQSCNDARTFKLSVNLN
jgi:hypothetical protein